MSYEAEYAKKLTTPEEAVKIVKSGDWIDYGWCANHPLVLDKALADRMIKEPDLTDLKFRGGVCLWMPEVAKIPNAKERMCWNSWHSSGYERKLTDKRIGYYIPLRFSELPRNYRDNIKHVDVAFIQVAPMDQHGYFNFGLSATDIAAVIECSDKVVVEVNKNMPVVLGGHEVSVHIDDVDMIVDNGGQPIGQLPSGQPSEIDEAVARLIVPEIPDGACLQLGIGGMPNAVGAMIAKSDLKDLSVHTEMYVDSFVDIARAGKLTCAKKAIDKGRQVFTFGAGTQTLYDYVNNNPAVMAAPVDYVNDARVIAQIDNFMSINNCIEVDLTGQVQELYLLLIRLYRTRRRDQEPHCPDSDPWRRCDRYPHEPELFRHRIRYCQPERHDDLAESGKTDFRSASESPRTAHQRCGRTGHLGKFQQEMIRYGASS